MHNPNETEPTSAHEAIPSSAPITSQNESLGGVSLPSSDARPGGSAASSPNGLPPHQDATRSRKKRVIASVVGALLLVVIAGLMLLEREHVAAVSRDVWSRLTGDEAGESDAESGEGKQLWTCGMHPQVIQDKPGNCPICNMKLTPLNVTNEASGTAKGERKIKYWWDPMLSPPYISDKPGKSPMGMDLIPVYEDEVSAGPQITIDPVVVQNMGVRVAEVKTQDLTKRIRAVGYLQEAQPNIHDVNLKVSGWIERLYADTEGMRVKQGDKLFELYSPNVLTAIDELIRGRRGMSGSSRQSYVSAVDTQETFYESAARKLALWGLDREHIERLAQLDRAPRTVAFTSPITGDVTEKLVVEGAAVNAGERVLRIVDHSVLWLDAQLYEQHLPAIKLGQKVTATVESLPDKQFEGEIIFIHPRIDPQTRTATVRISVPNPTEALRPGTYATVLITAPVVSDALVVPREAVIDTGERQVLFVALGGGKFEPREVKMGASGANGMVQVLKGVAPGEQVVTSGQFLLDSESRLKEAIQKHLDANLLAKKNQVPAGAPESHEVHTNAAAEGQADLGSKELSSDVKWTPDVDKVFGEYLRLAEVLGRAEPPTAPLDVDELVQAAEALVDVTPEPGRQLPAEVRRAASTMTEKPLTDQRKSFAALSEAVIRLAETCPPSKTVAEKLFILYCPMKQTHWIQTSDKVANPYYATDMKECGEVKRTITTVVNKNDPQD